jgi:hypothetical protein
MTDIVCPHVVGTTTQYCSLTPFTLTDAEREAVAYFAAFHRSPRESDANAAATLRSLLSRIGDCPVPENAANEDNASVRKTGGDFGQQPTLTDEERDEIEGIVSDFQEIAEFNAERCHPHYAEKARRRAAMLIGLLERIG